jgi:hypothetical protein
LWRLVGGCVESLFVVDGAALPFSRTVLGDGELVVRLGVVGAGTGACPSWDGGGGKLVGSVAVAMGITFAGVYLIEAVLALRLTREDPEGASGLMGDKVCTSTPAILTDLKRFSSEMV